MFLLLLTPGHTITAPCVPLCEVLVLSVVYTGRLPGLAPTLHDYIWDLSICGLGILGSCGQSPVDAEV